MKRTIVAPALFAVLVLLISQWVLAQISIVTHVGQPKIVSLTMSGNSINAVVQNAGTDYGAFNVFVQNCTNGATQFSAIVTGPTTLQPNEIANFTLDLSGGSGSGVCTVVAQDYSDPSHRDVASISYVQVEFTEIRMCDEGKLDVDSAVYSQSIWKCVNNRLVFYKNCPFGVTPGTTEEWTCSQPPMGCVGVSQTAGDTGAQCCSGLTLRSDGACVNAQSNDTSFNPLGFVVGVGLLVAFGLVMRSKNKKEVMPDHGEEATETQKGRVVICPSCETENDYSNKFCEQCGKQIRNS